MTPNIFHLAADNHPSLLPLLHQDPSLARTQDSHGYSLLHAAASYNYPSLVRALIHDFQLDINSLRDEDGETALFGVENVDMAKMLVEDFGADMNLKNNEGRTAPEKLIEEGEFLEVARYLQSRFHGGEDSEERKGRREEEAGNALTNGILKDEPPPPVPRDLEVNLSTVNEQYPVEDSERRERSEGGTGEEQQGEKHEEVVDLEFRRRIEELAAQGDITSEVGQRELRSLVTEAVREHVTHSSSNHEGRDQQRRRIT